MTTAEEILTQLKAKARPDQLEGMARFGINPKNRLGTQIPELRKLAKGIGKNHQLALELWQTGIRSTHPRSHDRRTTKGHRTANGQLG